MNLRYLATIILVVLLTTNLHSNENPHLVGMERFEGLKQIGTVKPRRSETIEYSRWGVQFNKYDVPDRELMLERIADSGVKWARVETRSYPVKPEDGYYKWSALDSVIFGLKNRGINIFVTFDEHAVEGSLKSKKPVKSKVIGLWLDYVRKLITRYKDHVHYWEILNEPKLNANYARLVIEASKAIKQIDPKAKILAGSLARIDVHGLEVILEHGVGPFIDILTYHPYNEFPESSKYPFYLPVKKPENYMQGGNLVSDLQKLLDKENRVIELWQGECGYPSAANSSSWQGRGPWGENIQAKWLLRRFLVDLSMDIPVSVYFILREPLEDERLNAKGLLRYGTWEPKPAYRALQNLTSLFDQQLNHPLKIEAKIEIVDAGCFYGVMGYFPDSFGIPYSNAKAPTPIEVFGVTGKNGIGIVYWLPWRMQEIISPARINLNVENVKIKNPALVDLLNGNIFSVKYSKKKDSIHLLAIPLTDYPLVIIEKDLVKN